MGDDSLWKQGIWHPKPKSLLWQGVLQGSILGPVLFLLSVNDMPLHLNNYNHWYIYACDTTLPLSANWKNITSLTKALSNDLQNIEKQSTENTMYISTKETKALLVTGKRLQHKLQLYVWKQQAYNYALMPQKSPKYHITNYWV